MMMMKLDIIFGYSDEVMNKRTLYVWIGDAWLCYDIYREDNEIMVQNDNNNSIATCSQSLASLLLLVVKKKLKIEIVQPILLLIKEWEAP